MTGAPLFTVIIPTYDRPRLLPLAVNSVLRQSITDLECVVVDDGGSSSLDPIEDGRVRVVRLGTNLGEPGARNAGLREARGRYVTFLDDDDEFTPDRLELALHGLEQAPISICWRRGSDGTSGGNVYLDGHVYERLLDRMTPQLGQVAFDRGIAPEFDERFAAVCDVEWLLRLVSRHPVRTVPRIGLMYRVHDGPRAGNGSEARVKGSVLLLRKHAGYFSRRPRAAAFRWKRIGLLAAGLGDHAMARRAYLRSLRSRPVARTAWHLVQSIRRSSRTLPWDED